MSTSKALAIAMGLLAFVALLFAVNLSLLLRGGGESRMAREVSCPPPEKLADQGALMIKQVAPIYAEAAKKLRPKATLRLVSISGLPAEMVLTFLFSDGLSNRPAILRVSGSQNDPIVTTTEKFPKDAQPLESDVLDLSLLRRSPEAVLALVEAKVPGIEVYSAGIQQIGCEIKWYLVGATGVPASSSRRIIQIEVSDSSGEVVAN